MADAQTTIAEKIAEIKTDRAKIRNHMKDNWGVATDTDKLKELATKITAIEKKTVAKELPEGGKYYIPKGYHDGTGWVEAVNNAELDAQEYKLEEGRKVTPTTEDQVISKSEGFYGLGAVTVNKIPTQYKDTTDVTATQAEVLAGKLFVDGTGLKAGTMPNKGTKDQILDTTKTSVTWGKGYYDSISVSVASEVLTATPTKERQIIESSTDKYLSAVDVKAIPDNYIDTTDATAVEADVLAGETAYTYETDESGNKIAKKITGTMPKKSLSETLTTENTAALGGGGYYTNISVSVFSTTGTATPSKSSQTIEGENGAFLRKVTVNPIPSDYITTVDATAAPADIIGGKTAYVKGSKVVGTIKDYGGVQKTINGLAETSVTLNGGYYSGIHVSLTSDIEEALAEI